MDTTALLQAIYRAYREKRLSEVLTYMDDSFRYVVHLPETVLEGGDKPRDKTETARLFGHFMEDYDFLAFDPGPIIVTGDRATVNSQIRMRHKRTGKELDTRITQTWQVKDGKAVALDEQHDVAKLEAFTKSLSDSGS